MSDNTKNITTQSLKSNHNDKNNNNTNDIAMSEDIIEDDIEEIDDVVEFERNSDDIDDVVEFERNTEEIENDDVYVISINGIPYFYEKDLTKARIQMQIIGKIYCENNTSYKLEDGDDIDELFVIQSVDMIILELKLEKFKIKIDKVEKFKPEL